MYLPHRPCGPQRAASLNLGTPKTDLSLSVAPTRSWRSVCVTITRPSCSRSERLTVRASRRWNRSRSRSCRRCASSWRTRARPCWVRTRSRTWAFLEGLDSCRSSDVKVFFKVEVDDEEEEKKKVFCSVLFGSLLSWVMDVLPLTFMSWSWHWSLAHIHLSAATFITFHCSALLPLNVRVCVCVERPGGQGCGACLSFLIFNQLLAITLVLVQCYFFFRQTPSSSYYIKEKATRKL